MFAIVASESARARAMPRRSPFTSVTCALCIATSVPVPIAMPDVGLRERGRVVDAVAGHRDDAALALQPLDQRQLVGGLHLAVRLVDAEPARHRARRGEAVAASPSRRGCPPPQRRERLGRAWP